MCIHIILPVSVTAVLKDSMDILCHIIDEAICPQNIELCKHTASF